MKQNLKLNPNAILNLAYDVRWKPNWWNLSTKDNFESSILLLRIILLNSAAFPAEISLLRFNGFELLGSVSSYQPSTLKSIWSTHLSFTWEQSQKLSRKSRASSMKLRVSTVMTKRPSTGTLCKIQRWVEWGFICSVLSIFPGCNQVRRRWTLRAGI